MIKRLLLAVILTASYSAYSNTPIEIVVPYPPGGANDKVGRVVSEIFNDRGWSNVVLNKAGADGVLGSNYVAKSKPDGRTLLVLATSTLNSNLIFKAQGIEYTEASFLPVAPVVDMGLVLVARADNPINTYDRFKFYVKTNPTQFNLAFYNANIARVWYEWAKTEKLPQPNVILYKGSGPQLIDVLGGHVPFAVDTWASVAPQVAAGKVRVLGTFDQTSLDMLKKVDPKADAVNIGRLHPELDINAWLAVWAPAGTPDSVTKEMNEVINQALKQPKYKERIDALRLGKNVGGSREDLAKYRNKTTAVLNKIKD
jgi:tripartite-type tricarboxylate transporter receptor subunit TctC